MWLAIGLSVLFVVGHALLLAAKGQGRQRLIEEVSDLFYHTLVLLSSRDIPLSLVQKELTNRHLNNIQVSDS